MEERYIYTVQPRRPIRGLIRGKIIIRPENLSLSKDEVRLCMKHGRVYRKFYLDSNLELVTPSNIDRLHRAVHLTEKQYEALKKKELEELNKVEEEVTEEEIEDTTEEVVEEITEEESIVEEDTEEVEEVSETEEEPIEEEVQTDIDDTPVEEPAVEEEPVFYEEESVVIKKEEEEQLTTESETTADDTEEDNVEMEAPVETYHPDNTQPRRKKKRKRPVSSNTLEMPRIEATPDTPTITLD